MVINKRLNLLNDEQKKAVVELEKSVSLTAGAGTGKTKVLTERFLYILTNGNLPKDREVQSILAITFTNKATNEMLSRIRNSLYELASENEEYIKFYRDSSQANIYTIHGFCQKLLAENPVEAKIDPEFKTADEDTSKDLLTKSINKVLNKKILDNNLFFQLLREFNYSQAKNFTGDIIEIFKELKNNGVDIKHLSINEEVEEININILDQIVTSFENIAKKGSTNSKMKKYLESKRYKDFVSRELEIEEVVVFLNEMINNFGDSKKDVEERDKLKAIIINELKKAEGLNMPYYKLIIDILKEVDEEYSQLKREERILDYDDLQILAKDLLDKEEILSKYRNQYKYIMIDEYQDTNSLQRQIFTKIANFGDSSSSNNLFIVGDPKQSIYGFRGSNLEEFYNTTIEIEKNNGINLVMGHNYRSSKSVIDYINKIFKGVMEGYYEPLDAKVDYENVKVEKHEKVIQGNLEVVRLGEAVDIASRITKLKDEGYNYNEIAILFRTSTNIHLYEKALKEKNIPYINNSSKKYYETQEVIDLVNIIKYISNNKDILSFVGVLRSPFIGISDDSVYKLFSKDNKDEFLENIHELPLEEQKLLEKGIKTIEFLSVYKNLLPLDEFISLIIEKMKYFQLLSTKFNGIKSVENIIKFQEITREFQANKGGNLEDFIDYICEKESSQENEAKVIEDLDAVNLITIHSSKGLEYKAVILPDFAGSTKGKSISKKINFSTEVGLGIDIENRSFNFNRNKEIKKEFEEEERKRVLYVAMTRAKERLILFSYSRNGKADTSSFAKLIEDFSSKEDYSICDIETDLEINRTGVKLFNKKYLNIKETPTINSLIKDEYLSKNKISHFYSPSKYMLFNHCKRKYYLQYHLNLKNVFLKEEINIEDEFFEGGKEHLVIDPIIKGNIIHKFIELYKDRDNIENLLGKVINYFGLIDSKEIRLELTPQIENYIKWNDNKFNYKNEVEVYYKTENGIIQGYIDQVRFEHDGIKIVDFKTNKIINQNTIDYYRPQLQIYAKAIEDIYSIKVKSSTILFLDSLKEVEVDITPKSLENRIKDFDSFIDFVESSKSIKDFKSNMQSCEDNCKYKNFCKL